MTLRKIGAVRVSTLPEPLPLPPEDRFQGFYFGFVLGLLQGVYKVEEIPEYLGGLCTLVKSVCASEDLAETLKNMPPMPEHRVFALTLPSVCLGLNDLDKLRENISLAADACNCNSLDKATAQLYGLAAAMALNSSRETANPRNAGWWNWLFRHAEKSNAPFSKELSEIPTLKTPGGISNFLDALLTVNYGSNTNCLLWSLASLYKCSVSEFSFEEALTYTLNLAPDVPLTAALFSSLWCGAYGSKGLNPNNKFAHPYLEECLGNYKGLFQLAESTHRVAMQSYTEALQMS